MTEHQLPHLTTRRGRLSPEGVVFSMLAHAWRTYYETPEDERAADSDFGPYVVDMVSEKHCLDPEKVRVINDAARLLVEKEAELAARGGIPEQPDRPE